MTTILRSLKEMQGNKIIAPDGDIGKVHEFYFDDEFWMVRYIVVDTGHWLPGRRVLISPMAFEEPDWKNKTLSIRLTRDQVERSPALDKDSPVSRQNEIQLSEYYDWSPYWQLADVGSAIAPMTLPAPYIPGKEMLRKGKGDPHLKNTREVIGYHIQAEDGVIGHVDDFVVDGSSWAIHYIVVNTKNWLPGKKVIISPWWVDEINWNESKMHICMPKQSIQNSPKYDFTIPINREYEDKLYEHYDRPKHWD